MSQESPISPGIFRIFRQSPRSRYLVEVGIVSLLLLATIAINWKMIRDGLNGRVDLKWHLTWLQHFSKQLAEGIWYPRWLAGTNYGYGSPTFVFQPPLVFYLGSLFRLSYFDAQDSLIILFSLAIFLSGFTFYIYGRNKWGSAASFCGALIYMTSPYIAFDIYWRGGLASVFVQAWIPLIWWLTERSLFVGKGRCWLALSWTLVAITHTPSLLICTFIWLPYTLSFLLQRPWKFVVKTLAFTALGFAIASLYLLPAVLEQSFINISFIKGEHGGIEKTLFGAGIPLFSSDLVDYIFIYQLLIILGLSTLAFLFFRQQVSTINEAWRWLILGLIVAFFMTSLAAPIWLASPTLQKVIFAWRLLQFFSFVGAVFGAIIASAIFKSRSYIKLLLSLAIIVILAFNFKYSYSLSRQFVTLRNYGRADIGHLHYIQKIIKDPYTEQLRDYQGYRPAPKNATVSYLEPAIGQPRLRLVNGRASIEIKYWQSYDRSFSVIVEAPSTIRIRNYYYPAWHLYVNQQPHPLTVADDGTMEFSLKPGSYQVQLRHQPTPAFILGIVISIASLITLILLCQFNTIFSVN